MLILVSGGSASGKSRFAEGLIVASPHPRRVYLATMEVYDGESEARVERHRAMRAGKGFETVECPRAVPDLTVPAGCALLVEDLSNLTANECFGGAGMAGAYGRILELIRALDRQAALTVVVTNELFSDGVAYPTGTADYLDCLARLNRALAGMAGQVYEVVCGIPIPWKGGA